MRRSVSFGVSGLFVITGSLGFLACGGGGDGGGRPGDDGMGGTATGGSGGSATGGSGGSATGGSAGSATGGSGGSGGGAMCDPPCVPGACEPMTPPEALLTDFTNLREGIFGANDENGEPKPYWWEGFYGGTFAYPIPPDECSADMTPVTYPIGTDTSGGNWRLTGTVGTYSGFGIWFQSCMLDLSAYSGVSFNMGGDVGPTGQLKFSISTSGNSPPDMCRTNQGTCTTGTCTSASTMVTVPATPSTVTIEFADLMDGVPEPTVNTAEIVGIQFELDCTDCTTTPYEIDLTIDDVTLVE